MSVSRKTIGLGVGIAAALWLAVAYALAPWAWRHYEHQRGLADRPMITTTRFGIPGDALNVGLEGDQADVICAMLRPAARSPRFPAQKPPNLCGANPEHFQICMVPT